MDIIGGEEEGYGRRRWRGMDIIGGEGRWKDMTGEDGGDGYYGRRGRGG